MRTALWDTAGRARVEALQWSQTQELLTLGLTVVIEWGSWGREERDVLRVGARAVGAAVELVHLDVCDDVLWARIQDRAAEEPPVTRKDLQEWRRLFEAPDDLEQSLYDPPPADPHI